MPKVAPSTHLSTSEACTIALVTAATIHKAIQVGHLVSRKATREEQKRGPLGYMIERSSFDGWLKKRGQRG